MVVLDQQHVLEPVEDLAKVAGALSGQAGAEGVLPARRQNEGTGAGGKRLLERVRLRSVVVDGDRDRNQSERPEQVEDADEARVFDCDPVAGYELGSERALDSVECAGDDRQRRALADTGAAPPGSAEEPPAAKLAIGRADGHRADAELGCELADRRQSRPRRQLSVTDRSLDARPNAASGAPDDSVPQARARHEADRWSDVARPGRTWHIRLAPYV